MCLVCLVRLMSFNKILLCFFIFSFLPFVVQREKLFSVVNHPLRFSFRAGDAERFHQVDFRA